MALGALVGCEQRKIKNTFEKVTPDATVALESLKKADAEVLRTRAIMKKTSSKSTKALVAAMHDYATALRATASVGTKLDRAIDEPFVKSGVETLDVTRTRVHTATTAHTIKCDRELKFDEIDPCGAAWGELLQEVDELVGKANRSGQSWPQPRTEETLADADQAAKKAIASKPPPEDDDDKPSKPVGDKSAKPGDKPADKKAGSAKPPPKKAEPPKGENKMPDY